MLKTPAIFLLAISSIASAIQIRVASYNVGAYYPSAEPAYGLGAPGTVDYEKVRDVLARINADVVALQEIHNIDIDDGVADTPEALSSLAANLGYDHIYIPPRTSLDFTLRVVVLSKFPLITNSIGSPEGAKDVTRRLPAVRVDIPGTDNDPLIIAGHLKSSTGLVDRFRRAVELKRVTQFLTTNNVTADDNFIVMGDFNLSSVDTTFTTAPTGLPSGYELGPDITFPIQYFTNVASYFTATGGLKIDLRQTDGSNITFPRSSSAIDVMVVSPAIANRPFASEVYNSTLDTSNAIGLRKAGSPPVADTSTLASDHLAIFADVELDVPFPQLDLAFNTPSVPENASLGTAKLTVTLPAPITSDLTINLASNFPNIARPISPTATISAGNNSTTIDVQVTRDFLIDSGNTVDFTASATNYLPQTSALQVLNIDAPYTFTTPGQTLVENFTTFHGTHDPAPWITSGTIPWLGLDSGTLAAPGFRSYNFSLGLLPDSSNSSPISFTASFKNDSSQLLEALDISYLAQQWRSSLNGTADQLTVAMVTPSGIIPLPSLTYSPATNLPSGPISPPAEIQKNTLLEGLSIPTGQSFDLRFTLTPGPGGGALPADVFINEFHYDNAGTDVGEFVEIVVGPGFTDALSTLRLYLYNGDGGALYNASTLHTLDTFTLGETTASGHRIFSKMISGIQNGAPDGFALTKGDQVLQFISYEGAFTATSGPASGMTSTDVIVSQPDTTPVNTNAIRLTGTGNKPADFTWTKSAIAHNPGVTNVGQTLTSPPQSQGISIDNISVKFIDLNIDTDGDGFTDRQETELFLTDPNDANSRFKVAINQPTTTSIRLEFPTLTGRSYQIQKSPDLIQWTNEVPTQGTGNPILTDLPILENQPKQFYRIKITLN